MVTSPVANSDSISASTELLNNENITMEKQDELQALLEGYDDETKAMLSNTPNLVNILMLLAGGQTFKGAPECRAHGALEEHIISLFAMGHLDG